VRSLGAFDDHFVRAAPVGGERVVAHRFELSEIDGPGLAQHDPGAGRRLAVREQRADRAEAAGADLERLRLLQIEGQPIRQRVDRLDRTALSACPSTHFGGRGLVGSVGL